MRRRHAVLREIEKMNPEVEYIEIYRKTAMLEFPELIALGTLTGFFKTFAARRVAGLLAHTGHILKNPARRAATTGILYYEVLYHGFDHPRGKTAINLTNQSHSHYSIHQDDYLYTLGTFFVESLRLVDRYGWRELSDPERQAMFLFNKEYGRRLGVDVERMTTLDEFLQWYDEYEERYLQPTPPVRKVYEANIGGLLKRPPKPLRPVVRQAIHTLFNDRLRAAVQVPRPSWWARALVSTVFTVHAAAVRWVLPPRKSYSFTPGHSRRFIFPNGYLLDPVQGLVDAG
ncbi:hypothetical protein GCM10010269_69080 [Streptomyces humidus]|uniref:ER-bound oxygenase mpaB/mpaB'/Rubber oxygenase catalytic domain-containing protein n=2 Tax=Streptomyces humidus TaxID=52259 RepID=A0A918L930_9ACTN|nr:hypothetical protein GCM10010269_69080 [Streptomyces humidus]